MAPPEIGERVQVPWSFTDDGKRLAFVEVNPTSGANVWTIPVESHNSGLRAGNPEPFLQASFDERTPMFSPGTRWLAYSSNESGVPQVYVQGFSDKGGKRQISAAVGIYPVWSRNRRELFFRDSEKRLANFGTTRSYDVARTVKTSLHSCRPTVRKGRRHKTVSYVP
jgi:Tol biopolymer transport system component